METNYKLTRGGKVFRLRVSHSAVSPERQAAIDHFKASGCLIAPSFAILDSVDRMTPEEAQRHMDSLGPQPIRYEFFVVRPVSTAVDQDLAGLEYLPEITSVTINSNRISDIGVGHLKYLLALKDLRVMSDTVSDRCLATIAQLQSLERLELWFCPRISRRGAIETAAKLPRMYTFAPPQPRGLYRWLRLCLLKLKLAQKFDPHLRSID